MEWILFISPYESRDGTNWETKEFTSEQAVKDYRRDTKGKQFMDKGRLLKQKITLKEML